ncbi:MAG: SDR family NAD(P)-dependent oxidoreductase [Sphaerochaetaceae bacterium]|jgi:3-oxoacyl-[acyl-carrier protein] reductase|nr:SDR family NAD(P)-dependent oxidoreductase [Sphaerochaetaceae bacterium]
MRFTGKTAVITGAARGIGKVRSDQLAEEGAAVVLVDIRHADEIARKLQDSGAKALALHIDITDYDAVRHAVDEIVAWNNGIDILVNNAGIIARGNITELTVETWLKVMDVNLNGTFYLCKAILPFMIEKRYGRIVNVTSIAAKTGDITAAAAYGTSKGAVNTLTRSLARQMAEFGITVNAVAPHAIETDMSAEWPLEKRKAVIDSIPLKRMGTCRDVSEAVLYLASDAASFVTGETINVNGGYLMD